MTMTMPVSGARILAANKPAMAKIAQELSSILYSGNVACIAKPNNTPQIAPRAIVGEKIPPGAPEPKQIIVATNRKAKMRKRG